MALLKSIPLGNTGIAAEYWNVSSFSVDFISNITNITMAGYVNQASRLAGNGPVMTKHIRWVGSQNPITQTRLVTGQAFTFAYAKIVAANTNPLDPQNPFEGATSAL